MTKRRSFDWQIVTIASVLVIIVSAFGTYLIHRRDILDHREANTEKAICAILNAIPAHFASVPAKERLAFEQAYKLERCVPIKRPVSKTHSPTPHSTQGASTPTEVPVVPSEHSVVVTATTSPSVHHQTRPTSTAKPKPHHTHSPTPSPSPPLCITLQCLLKKVP